MNILGIIVTVLFFVISFAFGFYAGLSSIVLAISRRPDKFCAILKKFGHFDSISKYIKEEK